jgi:polysaccharide export outer membrane protein
MNTAVLRCASVLLASLLMATSVYGQSRLRSGDQISITIAGVPASEAADINRAYKINENGNINLVYLEPVRAVGLTHAELEQRIESAYRSAQIFTDPTVNVATTGGARFVNIQGDGINTTRVPFTEDMTLTVAISAAGGLNQYADEKKVFIVRDGQRTRINYKEILENPEQDIILKPGDMITVGTSWF